jgi:hypothetical protein
LAARPRSSAAPEWDEQGRFVFSDHNLFLRDSRNSWRWSSRRCRIRLFRASRNRTSSRRAAEASFLAGGEFPSDRPGQRRQHRGQRQFKEFGVRLNFTPTVNGNRVHLKVRPEVSALDFNNSVVLGGFRIPSLTTRRTETELELNNGQTFAIAGLMNNTMLSSLQKIPGLGDIPILGLLFRSKAAQKNQTELVVMITPEILPNNSRGVTPGSARRRNSYPAGPARSRAAAAAACHAHAGAAPPAVRRTISRRPPRRCRHVAAPRVPAPLARPRPTARPNRCGAPRQCRAARWGRARPRLRRPAEGGRRRRVKQDKAARSGWARAKREKQARSPQAEDR